MSSAIANKKFEAIIAYRAITAAFEPVRAACHGIALLPVTFA
jgi:hypothetical protein